MSVSSRQILSQQHCATHEDVHAVAKCTQCGALMCLDCHGFDEHGMAVCPSCRDKALQDTQSQAEEDAIRPVPLEDTDSERGLAARILETLRLVIINPLEFSVRLLASNSLLRPLIFAYLCIVFGGTLSRIWDVTLELEGYKIFMEAVEKTNETMPSPMELPDRFWTALYVMSVPFEAFFRILMGTAVLHAGSVVAGGKGSLRKSTQVYAYSAGAFVLAMLPMVGMTMAVVVQIFALFAGLQVVHKLTVGRAMAVCSLSFIMTILFVR